MPVLRCQCVNASATLPCYLHWMLTLCCPLSVWEQEQDPLLRNFATLKQALSDVSRACP